MEKRMETVQLSQTQKSVRHLAPPAAATTATALLARSATICRHGPHLSARSATALLAPHMSAPQLRRRLAEEAGPPLDTLEEAGLFSKITDNVYVVAAAPSPLQPPSAATPRQATGTIRETPPLTPPLSCCSGLSLGAVSPNQKPRPWAVMSPALRRPLSQPQLRLPALGAAAGSSSRTTKAFCLVQGPQDLSRVPRDAAATQLRPLPPCNPGGPRRELP